MSDRPSKSSSIGGRNAALLLALAPLATGVYQEGQQQRQRYAEREQTRKQAEEQRLASEAEVDTKTADALQQVLLQAGDRFCSRIELAASLLKTQTVSKRTRTVLIAALQLPDPVSRQPMVCECIRGEASEQWLAEFIAKLPDDKGDSLSELNKLARGAESRCEVEAKASTESNVDALQQQIASLTSERDALRQQVQQHPLPATSPTPPPVLAAPPPAVGASPPEPACVIASPGDRPRIRVFIQVPNSSALAAATPLREALNAQGQFKSPQIENVGESRSPAQLQVRYTYPADESAAQIVVDALKDQPGCGRGGLELKRVYMGRFQGRTDKGVIEVWWPKPTVAKQEPSA